MDVGKQMTACQVFWETFASDREDEAGEDWEQAQVTLLACLMTVAAALTSQQASSVRRWWVQARPQDYFEKFVESFPEDLFRRELRVGRKVFDLLCLCVQPYMDRDDTNYRKAIPVRRRVTMTLKRIGTGMRFIDIGNWFGCGKATVQAATHEFCEVVSSRLVEIFVRWPTAEQLPEVAEGFQRMHGIPGIAGAIDGSYIPVDPPQDHRADYYCRKGYYSILPYMLQLGPHRRLQA